MPAPARWAAGSRGSVWSFFGQCQSDSREDFGRCLCSHRPCCGRASCTGHPRHHGAELPSAQAGQKVLSQARIVTIVADRESDIYEEWARLPDERTHLLTRACHDRVLAGTYTTLYRWLGSLPAQGVYSFTVPARLGKRSAHVAQVAVRTMQLTQARDGAGTAQASEVFEAQERMVLRKLQPTLEGKTAKQKNPHPPGSQPWCGRHFRRCYARPRLGHRAISLPPPSFPRRRESSFGHSPTKGTRCAGRCGLDSRFCGNDACGANRLSRLKGLPRHPLRRAHPCLLLGVE